MLSMMHRLEPQAPLLHLTVNEDAAITSLGLTGVTYGPGGGADEASQAFTYTVTGVPAATLGNITLLMVRRLLLLTPITHSRKFKA